MQIIKAHTESPEDAVKREPFLALVNSRIDDTARVTTNGEFMDRVDVYKSERYEVRGHVLRQEDGRNFVHNHAYSFSTTCVGGPGYVEKRYEEQGHEGEHHYRTARGSGGGFGEPEKRAGMVMRETSSKHLKPGEGYIIKPHQYHDVIPEKGETLTIVVRDLQSKKPGHTTFFISETKEAIHAHISKGIKSDERADKEKANDTRAKFKAAIEETLNPNKKRKIGV